MPAENTTPRATYRLQFNENFHLRDALAVIPYLRELGISHVYASPLLKATAHSTHGYDTVDFTSLNPELGTESDLAELVAALRAHQMGLVVDIVPNHMGIGGRENKWWWDVLTYGPASRYATYFDIDWQSPDPRLKGKVLAPILGDRYDRVLEKGDLKIHWENGEYTLRYFENILPLNPRSFDPAAMDLEKVNTNPDALDAILQSQYYRLTFHRYGDRQLNYRRFFNITTMAGLRMEDPNVFKDVQSLITEWVKKGWLDGLRVDHPDGLRDPETFLRRLRETAPNAWIVVEKIIEPGEHLPSSWPVAGTTGYDFLNYVEGVFIDSDGEKPLTDFYAEFTGGSTDFGALVREKKRIVLGAGLAAEVNRLADLLFKVAAGHWRYRDFSRREHFQATAEMVTCLPVYRTYIRPEEGVISPEDIAFVEQAAAEAEDQRPDLPAQLFHFLKELLLLRLRGVEESDFVARFQQLTGPEMAKGVEDTAFYCFNRFIALNEVGGNPGCFSLGVEEFHKFCGHQQEHWPEGMLSTSTHDTKRSGDVRARLNVLSEIATPFAAAVLRWSAMNEKYRRDGWPDRNAEYLFYQTLIGAWPLSVERALAYMVKAACEAKQHTRWSHRNAAYETALRDFITSVLADSNFRRDLEAFVGPLVDPGYVNALSQTLIKLTAPGVPDCYQGTELWDDSLVDPDNRRPVDFEIRRHLLEEVKPMLAEEVWRRRATGLPKLWLIRKVLELRSRQPALFSREAGYQPVAARGAKAQHMVAFRRGENLITVIPRLVARLNNDWADTAIDLPSGSWQNELTGESMPPGAVPLAEILRRFPVALLIRKDA
jgi:(1->4)-alpha-D-glucan 1-alpha-D-glucosylmutase